MLAPPTAHTNAYTYMHIHTHVCKTERNGDLWENTAGRQAAYLREKQGEVHRYV